jgi:hypothetical protein
MSTVEIEQQEDVFLDKIHELMVRANYKLLSQQEYDMAMEEGPPVMVAVDCSSAYIPTRLPVARQSNRELGPA